MRRRPTAGSAPLRRALTGTLALSLLVAATTGVAAHPSEDKLQRQGEGGSVGIVIDEPAGLPFVPATPWSGAGDIDDQRGEVVFVGSGCTPLSYATADVDGKIALSAQSVPDGATDPCPAATFLQRVQLAQAAGAIGLIHLADEGRTPGGDALAGDIPALEVAFDAGTDLRDLVVDQGEAVTVTFQAAADLVPQQRLSDEACVDGLAADLFACDGIDLLSFVPLDEFEGQRDARQALGGGASDLWGWTDGETGDEYVIIGTTTGVAFYRVTDPTDPVFLGRLDNRAALQLIWHDIKVYDDHAFIVSESNPHGMKVFDLTKLREVEEPQTFTEDAFYPLTIAAHNIELNVDTGFAYIVGGNAALVVPDPCLHGLHIVDVNDPKAPTFAGCYLAEGGPGTGPRLAGADDLSPFAYVHDAQCVLYDGPDDRFHEREICFNSAEDKIVIADVTDKLNPVTLGVTDYPMVAYAHQGWLTEDQSFLLVNDEADETSFGINTRTVVIDVTDLTDPKFHFGHSHDTASITHNNYVVGDLVFQSNYTSGLRVLDVSGVAERPEGDDDDRAEIGTDASPLTEVAFFDTFPAHGDATFDGTWSNYPYFESGTLAVSGIDEGLFLLRLQDDPEDAPLELRCDDCPIEVRAGETGSATLRLVNPGAERADVTLHVEDVPEGWTTTLDPDALSVPPGDERTAALEVAPPRRAKAGETTVTVVATDGAGERTLLAVDVEVRKGPPSGVGRSGRR